ncbi:MAG TPA: hypothetical protein VNT56_11450 [Acidimicrobiales bacterium]|nr:hypothetical protein [Acidimicrobiales bacterium]
MLGQVLGELGPVFAGNLLHDTQTVVLMSEHVITRIVTRDTELHRFPGLEVVDPLAPEVRESTWPTAARLGVAGSLAAPSRRPLLSLSCDTSARS